MGSKIPSEFSRFHKTFVTSLTVSGVAGVRSVCREDPTWPGEPGHLRATFSYSGIARGRTMHLPYKTAGSAATGGSCNDHLRGPPVESI